jgi:hypothetical protein
MNSFFPVAGLYNVAHPEEINDNKNKKTIPVNVFFLMAIIIALIFLINNNFKLNAAEQILNIWPKRGNFPNVIKAVFRRNT